MIAAEQWHEYQKQYQKYGIEMAPEHQTRKVRQERRKTAQVKKETVLHIGNDRKLMLGAVLVCAVALIMVVVMASYAAKLTYDINQTKIENDVIMGEIEDLDVAMLSAESISYVESQAKKELGMKAANSKNCVYITAEDVPAEGFGDIIKARAYE